MTRFSLAALACVSLVSVGLIACSESKDGAQAVLASHPSEPLVASEGSKVLAIKVEGMHCTASCTPAVYEAVTSLEGVETASVSLEEQAAWVSVPADSEMTVEDLAEAISEAFPSYEVSIINDVPETDLLDELEEQTETPAETGV